MSQAKRAARSRLILLLGLVSALAVGSITASASSGPKTERLYLSGSGRGDAVEWEFSIDRGRGAGGWARIPVPSQWELQGFGDYAYGRNDEARPEVGSYRQRFDVPAEWRGRRVELVFEGVMTDTVARLNGATVGPAHRGGFTRFGYDVTELLRFADSNLLEVEVSEESADRSVNAAEREADYWVFGGIYRPVYLEASPAASIAHLAIDASHEGDLKVAVETRATGSSTLSARVKILNGDPVGSVLQAEVEAEGVTRLEGRFEGVRPWSAEHPNLYELEVSLQRGGRTVHVRTERFGFRTVEVRAGQGIFINGRRVLLKGINRHSFWPDSGRTLDREINRRDAELLKQLNANAVRASHYPPDVEFLRAADELGLYVIDELPGWHDAYDTAVGRDLVAELVRRDVNHPSVILWANGNEGGWNRALDLEFGRHDPQKRPVIHPQDVFSGIDTEHYPSWNELAGLLDDTSPWNRLMAWLGRLPLVLPTEMLHGLYDGGLGAGLEDYWRLIRSSPRAAGAFLWAFLDEGVVRTDRGGAIDTHGNHAPDGLVGPYRGREASFYAVRDLWSPVVFSGLAPEAFPGEVTVENRFDQTDLVDCSFHAEWLRLPGPFDEPSVEVVATHELRPPRLGPGEKGRIDTGEPPADAEALRLVAFDPQGRSVAERVFRLSSPAALRARWFPEGIETGVGPEIAGSRRRFEQVEEKGVDSVSWADYAEGSRLTLEASRDLGGSYQGLAVDLTDPAGNEIVAVEWLGGGPGPVWANRRAGTTLGLWRRTAGPRTTSAWQGFYADVLWFRAIGSRWTVTVLPIAEDEVYVGVSPEFPDDARHARADVPPAGKLSLLLEIPAIGSKFHPPEDLGPAKPSPSRARAEEAPRKETFWLLVEPSDTEAKPPAGAESQ